MYAVVKTGGKQVKLETGMTEVVEKLDVPVGGTVTFTPLFVSDDGKALVGGDVAGVTVTAEIVEHFRGAKQIVFKFKKRKGYKKLRGHRQDQTRIRVTDIALPGAAPKKAAAKKPAAAKAPKAAASEAALETPVVEAPAAEKPVKKPAARKPAAPKAAAAKTAAPKAAAPKAAGTAETAEAAEKPAAKKPAARKPAARKPAAKKDTPAEPSAE